MLHGVALWSSGARLLARRSEPCGRVLKQTAAPRQAARRPSAATVNSGLNAPRPPRARARQGDRSRFSGRPEPGYRDAATRTRRIRRCQAGGSAAGSNAVASRRASLARVHAQRASGRAPRRSSGSIPLHWLTNPTSSAPRRRRRRDDPHPRRGQRRGAAGRSEHVPRQGVVARTEAIPGTISAASVRRSPREVKNADRRRLDRQRATRRCADCRSTCFPVSGEISTLLGGMTSAGIGLTLQYADLNQPQTISAPANAAAVQRL